MGRTIKGTRKDDFITGRKRDDRILAGKGDDTIFGGKGNDVLYGNDGTDFLTGGAGKDRFALTRGTNYITDFDLDEGDTLFNGKRGTQIRVTESVVINDDLFVTYTITNPKGKVFEDNTLVLMGTGDRFQQGMLNFGQPNDYFY